MRRRTLQISSSESKEETGDKLVEPIDQEAKTLAGRKAWNPKVENLNMCWCTNKYLLFTIKFI